jgi:DNA primase
MFTIPGHPQFMTTIGKLNFFRWALESKILEYIEAHEEEIRTGYNSYLKDTTQTQKRVKNDTASSTDSNVSSESVQSNITVLTQVSQSTQSTQGTQGTQSTQGSNSTTRTTRRRRTKQTPSSLNKLQVYKIPIELSFN